MDYMTAPLKLSAVGFRAAGFLLENNLRAARYVSEAVLSANPFWKYSLSIAMPESDVSKPISKTAKASVTSKRRAVSKSKSRPVAKVQATSSVRSQNAAPKSKPSQTTPALTDKAIESPVVKLTQPKSNVAVTSKHAPRKTRQPSSPPPMPPRSAKR